MLRFLYFFPIFIFNVGVYPYFHFIEDIAPNAPIYFLFIGLYFTGVIGGMNWPFIHWFLKYEYTKKSNKLDSLAVSLINAALSISLLVGLAYLSLQFMDYVIPGYVTGVLSYLILFLPLALIVSPLVSWLCVTGLLFAFNRTFRIQPNLIVITGASAWLTFLLMFFILGVSSSDFCGRERSILWHSGYLTHVEDLCRQRDDTSECPQSPTELRAFQPQIYDRIQNCYYPMQIEQGYQLAPRIKKF